MTITAIIIADSISPDGIRLTTMQLRYPRFIHAEFMTHRLFSRNASSSRAIPVARLIEDIRRDPAMPIHWGKNQPGMQASAESVPVTVVHTQDYLHDHYRTHDCEAEWRAAMNSAIRHAELFQEAGYHKQIVNRLLEPFSHINVVVTATEWENFYALRRHPDAQPEIKALADAMWEVQAASTPKLLQPGEWHVPYIIGHEREWFQLVGEAPNYPSTDAELWQLFVKLSVARCARVSYLTHEGKPPEVAADLALYDRLVGAVPLHASPAEHQATPDTTWKLGQYQGGWANPAQHGNFTGWRQYRKMLPGESGTSAPKTP